MKNKIAVIALILAIVLCILFPVLAQRLVKPSSSAPHVRLPILMYHHFNSDPRHFSNETISPDKFLEDMLYLKATGFNTVSFQEVMDYTEHKGKLPQNPIVITIDDGYESNYQYAYPTLKSLNMKATIFVIGWSVGQTIHKDGKTEIIPHFTWQQAKEMFNSGLIEIQPHTFDMHDNGQMPGYPRKGVSKLPSEPEQEYRKVFAEDTQKVKNLIEQNIGNKAFVYSYPYGISNSTSDAVLKDLGMKITVGTVDGISETGMGLAHMKRINVSASLSSIDLSKRLKPGDKSIPFTDIQDQAKRIEELKKIVK